uniref:Ig-like domain-containing protein n=1 Tax=Periophthalmus magnuspinnatus TaxID=409849 RepID=A0A3B3Z956_9GOBI
GLDRFSGSNAHWPHAPVSKLKPSRHHLCVVFQILLYFYVHPAVSPINPLPPLSGRAPPHILPLALSDKHVLVAVGSPIVLQCQVSEPAAQVTWARDQVELFCRTGLDMKRDGCVRKLMVHCAKPSDAGLYSCSLAQDVVTFRVHVQGEVCGHYQSSLDAVFHLMLF